MFSALFCIIGFFAIFEHRSVSLDPQTELSASTSEYNAHRKETNKTNWRTPTFSVHVIFPHSTTHRAISNMKQNTRTKTKNEYSRVTVRVIDYYVCDLVFILLWYTRFVCGMNRCGYNAKRRCTRDILPRKACFIWHFLMPMKIEKEPQCIPLP